MVKRPSTTNVSNAFQCPRIFFGGREKSYLNRFQFIVIKAVIFPNFVIASMAKLDKASAYGAEDCRFESCWTRYFGATFFFFFFSMQKGHFLLSLGGSRGGGVCRFLHFCMCHSFKRIQTLMSVTPHDRKGIISCRLDL